MKYALFRSGLIFIFIILLLSFSCCGNIPLSLSTVSLSPSATTPGVASPTPTEQKDVVSPLYAYRNAGSAKVLEGNCVFITVAVTKNPANTAFSTEMLRTVLTPAMEFLEKEAKAAGKVLNLIYLEPDLITHAKLKMQNIRAEIRPQPSYPANYTGPRLEEALTDYPQNYTFPSEQFNTIVSKFDLLKIKQKYAADNVCFLFFLADGNISYHSYSLPTTEDNTVEAAFIFGLNYFFPYLNQNKFASYAQGQIVMNILSLFGAISYTNLNNEQMLLATEYFPNDIMAYPDSLERNIGPLTRYCIGWEEVVNEKYESLLH